MTGADIQKLSLQKSFVPTRIEASSKRIVVESLTRDYRRGANDLCVYVLKPGDSSKRMIVVNTAGSWKDFLNSIGEKLKVNVLRVFNKRDEIKKLSDLSQGDILAIQHGSDQAASPKEHGSNLQQNASMHWAKLCRLITLQCLEDYVITEIIKVAKHSETLRARRKHDNMPVIIKRIASSKRISTSTLRSYILLCCSIRHPRIVNHIDVFMTDDIGRIPGIAKRKKPPSAEKCSVLTIVMERYDTNLETHFEQRLKLQKPLTTHEIVGFITQVLHILHYLHADLRTVHRNIKMSNFLLDKAGNLFLADFAIPAVNPSSEAFHMRQFCQNSIAQRRGLLTPKTTYCSPEAFTSGRTSEKDDIWALGCIITELVTHKAVADRTSGEIFARSLGAIAQAVAEVEYKDSALGSLCRVFFETDPGKRPGAFEILWRHLRTVCPEAQPQAVPLTLSIHDSSMTSMISRSNDIPTLITALLRHEFSPGMEAAAMRLNEIVHSEPSKRGSMRDIFATPVGRMTGLNALSSCLLKGTPYAQQLAASALRTSTLDDENEKVFQSEDVAVLVGAVLMGNPPTQANAAAVLSNICCNSSRMREALHAADGISALTALISGGVLNACLLEAASAIRNSCIAHEGNRNDFMKANGVATLVRVLQSEFVGQPIQSSRVIMTLENVVGALRNCCNQHNGNCMSLAMAEGIPVVVRLATGAPLNIQEQIAGLIRNCCIGYFENKNHMARCGAYWSFVQMLHQTAITQTLREEIVSAIRYSTIGHRSNRNILGESGLIRALVSILVPGPFEGTMRAKEEAAAALRIACDGSESNSIELYKCSGIQALMELIASPGSSKIAREEALSAAANACSHFTANIDFLIDQPSKHQHIRATTLSPDVTEEARFYSKCLLILIDQRKSKNGSNTNRDVNDSSAHSLSKDSDSIQVNDNHSGQAEVVDLLHNSNSSSVSHQQRQDIPGAIDGTDHKHFSLFPSPSSLPHLATSSTLGCAGIMHPFSTRNGVQGSFDENQMTYSHDIVRLHAPAPTVPFPLPRYSSNQISLKVRISVMDRNVPLDRRWPYVALPQKARRHDAHDPPKLPCEMPRGLHVSASTCPGVKYEVVKAVRPPQPVIGLNDYRIRLSVSTNAELDQVQSENGRAA